MRYSIRPRKSEKSYDQRICISINPVFGIGEARHFQFTKRIQGMKDLTYCQRLARLKLDSLELRRVRLDLILMFTYKLVFGLTDLKLPDFFLLHSDARSRGHPYKRFLPGCSSLALFKRSLSSNILARYCKTYYF